MDWSMCVVTSLMFLTVLLPQTGYIHPDEFFQSAEIVAGDIFNITHRRTWEFEQEETPIRDIVLSYLIYAPGYHTLKTVLRYIPSLPSYVQESYFLLVIPRLIISVVGLINYFVVKKLCSSFYVDKSTAVWYYATSYVVWSFLTRSFSNCIETALFSITLYLVLNLEEVIEHIMLWKKRGSKTAESLGADINNVYRKMSVYSFLFGVVLSVGFFNRPTFVIFAIVPISYWLDHLTVLGYFQRAVLVSSFLTTLGAVLGFVLMSVLNSLYYNPEFGPLLNGLCLAVLKLDPNLVFLYLKSLAPAVRIPPWNFIKFNTVRNNLVGHGLHPWYTHLAVNLPLLLGPLFLLITWDLQKMLRYYRQTERKDVLYTMVFIPVLFLSFFPHQEARFLLPIMPVAVVCAARNSVSKWKTFKALMLLFNLLAFMAFGWLHQGAIIPAMAALQLRLKEASADPSMSEARFTIFSYSSYMLPSHLLFHPNNSNVQVHIDNQVTGQNNPHLLHWQLKLAKSQCRSSCRPEYRKCFYYIFLASPAVDDLRSIKTLNVTKSWEYCPHFSGERLPKKLKNFWSVDEWYRFFSQLCLTVVYATF